jgi:hypothetical protein
MRQPPGHTRVAARALGLPVACVGHCRQRMTVCNPMCVPSGTCAAAADAGVPPAAPTAAAPAAAGGSRVAMWQTWARGHPSISERAAKG